MRVIDADAYSVHIEKARQKFIDEVGVKAFEDSNIYVVLLLDGVIGDLRDAKITPTIDKKQDDEWRDLIDRSDVLYELLRLREEIWLADIPQPGACKEYQEHHKSIQHLLKVFDDTERKIREMEIHTDGE